MGTLPRDLAARGRVVLGDHLLDAARPEGFRPHWGLRIAVLPQEPWLSLDPLMRAGRQVTEAHHLVRGLGTQDARAQAATDLDRLGLAHAGTRYPHELSGGMAQRVAIAAARAGGAGIVIADEPTKGLDAARRDEVADLLLAELARGGGLLVITHDLALARRIGGRMIVLRAGRVVETGPTAAVMAAPTQAYTRDLIAADPENWPARNRRPAGAPVLTATRLAAGRGGVRLFSDLSFDLSAGRILGVTGPSGCGKSTLGDVVLGLAPPAAGRVNRSAGLAPTAFRSFIRTLSRPFRATAHWAVRLRTWPTATDNPATGSTRFCRALALTRCCSHAPPVPCRAASFSGSPCCVSSLSGQGSSLPTSRPRALIRSPRNR